jgi:hypothetical protein
MNPKYEIRLEEDGRVDSEDGELYDIYNVFYDGKYLFSADTEWQANKGISKREQAISKKTAEVAANAFLAAHEGSSYLKYPMTSATSGMGRKG